MYLYLMTNRMNGKQYVGITKRKLTVRMRDHYSVAFRGRLTLIARALRKYGKEAFTVQLLGEATSWEELTRMEQAAIGLYKTFMPDGYNMTRGGDGTIGWKHSEEAKQKMSLANTGRPASDAQKAAVSKALRGVPKSVETRAKMGAWQRGEGNNRYGKHVSEEHKQRLREVHSGNTYSVGRTASPETRAKLSAARTGKRHSQESIAKMAEAKRGKSRSEETKAKVAAGLRAYYAEHESPFKGKVHTEESRAKISANVTGLPAWNKGKKTGPLSEETRTKLSAAHKGQKAWNKGIPHSKEAKAKMAASRTGGKNWKARAIVLNGVTYPSIMDAVRATGLSRMQVSYRLETGRARYLDEEQEPQLSLL